MARSVLLLGSNLGDREGLLDSAREKLNEKAGKVIKSSSMYETEPWGFEAENSFLNQVIIIETDHKPANLLFTLQDIELDLGRKRCNKQYESRLIDIDVLFYGDEIINTKDLIIPHPRIQERMFVLKPLMEISPDLTHPVLEKSINALFDNCKDKLKVEIFQKSNNKQLITNN